MVAKSKCVSSKSVYLWGSVHKEKPPKRAVCLWSLGPVKRDNWWCFHYKVWGNVGVGAQYECVCMCLCVCVCIVGVGRLTQLPPLWHQPLLRLVQTSLCFQMPSYKHDTRTCTKSNHTHICTETSPQRQIHTHTHTDTHKHTAQSQIHSQR